MSDANRIRVSLIEEGTFGLTPSSPSFLVLPTTGQSLRDRIGYQRSQTIRSDANIKDLVRLSKSAGGGLPCELSFAETTTALYAAIQASLRSGAEVAARTEASATTTNGTSTVTKAAINFTTGDPIEAGDIVKVSGTSTAAEDGYYKVTTVAATTVTLQGITWTGTSAGAVTITRAARMKNGTTDRSFSIEVARTDIDIAQIFTGHVFDSMDISVSDEAITTISFSLAGSSSTRISAPISGTGSSAIYVTSATNTDPTSHPVLDSVSVPEIRVAGSDYAAKSLGATVNHSVASRTEIGEIGPQSMRRGSCGVSIRLRSYMDDFNDLDDFAGNTSTDVWFVMIDANGKGWSFSFPQCKFSDAGADTQGLDQDDYQDSALTAYLHPTELCTVRVQRWA